MDGGRPLFGPGTVTWTVNRELVLLAGGGRALLLQVAHPLVAAGVEQHSDYRRDPWGRLRRTLDLTTKIAFADPETARRARERVARTHRRVRGSAADGTPYDARDPALLLWVWATLADTSLLVFRRAVRPLGVAELDTYFAEQVRFAETFGIPAEMVPADWASFRAYFDGMVAHELRVTEAARAVAGVDACGRPGSRRRRCARRSSRWVAHGRDAPRARARGLTGSHGRRAGRGRRGRWRACRGRCCPCCRASPASSRSRGGLRAANRRALRPTGLRAGRAGPASAWHQGRAWPAGR